MSHIDGWPFTQKLLVFKAEKSRLNITKNQADTRFPKPQFLDISQILRNSAFSNLQSRFRRYVFVTKSCRSSSCQFFYRISLFLLEFNSSPDIACLFVIQGIFCLSAVVLGTGVFIKDHTSSVNVASHSSKFDTFSLACRAAQQTFLPGETMQQTCQVQIQPWKKGVRVVSKKVACQTISAVSITCPTCVNSVCQSHSIQQALPLLQQPRESIKKAIKYDD